MTARRNEEFVTPKEEITWTYSPFGVSLFHHLSTQERITLSDFCEHLLKSRKIFWNIFHIMLKFLYTILDQ